MAPREGRPTQTSRCCNFIQSYEEETVLSKLETKQETICGFLHITIIFVNFISASHTINYMTDNLMLAGHTQELFTMCDGAAKLQQAAEGQ